MFRHISTPVVLENIRDETTDHGRWYHTPDGKRYPSVTTVLSAGTDKSWLEAWKKRIGEDAAKRELKRATDRGTAVHDMAEQYLLNNPNYKGKHNVLDIASFSYIKPFLDNNIEEVMALEAPLYSHFLRTAGRVDCISKWNGKWSIVDFKTSKRRKQRDDIHNYFMQESAYAYMVYERTGIPITQLVTVMTVDDSEPLLFVENAKEFLPKFIEIRNGVDL